jgi:hypothetical protein
MLLQMHKIMSLSAGITYKAVQCNYNILGFSKVECYRISHNGPGITTKLSHQQRLIFAIGGLWGKKYINKEQIVYLLYYFSCKFIIRNLDPDSSNIEN